MDEVLGFEKAFFLRNEDHLNVCRFCAVEICLQGSANTFYTSLILEGLRKYRTERNLSLKIRNVFACMK